MISFIKKDILMIWRDRKELIMVLALPILLVIVLNFAFSGLSGSEENLQNMDLQLAVVNQDDESGASARLEQRLTEEAGLDTAEAASIAERAGDVRPVQRLLAYLNSEELGQWVTIHELQESKATAKVREGELDGILLIPEGYAVEASDLGSQPDATGYR